MSAPPYPTDKELGQNLPPPPYNTMPPAQQPYPPQQPYVPPQPYTGQPTYVGQPQAPQPFYPPPPQPGYQNAAFSPGPVQQQPQGGQQQQSTVIINQQRPVVVAQYGFNPMRITCPHCNADVVTAIDYEVGGYAWMICGIITLIGLFLFAGVLLGCCLIPFCVPDCKDVVHICPNCRQTLARVPRR